MASFVRPSVLRQAGAAAAAPAKRMMATTSTPSKTLLTSQMTRSAFRKETLPSAFRVAAFHNTARNNILPPLPQKLDGSVNDPVSIPEPHPTHGSYHWSAERLVSVAIVPVTIAPFAAGTLSPVIDSALIALIVVHSHMGFQSIITDYLPSKRVPVARKLFDWGAFAGAIVVAVGFYEFETNDVGLTEAIKRIWKA